MQETAEKQEFLTPSFRLVSFCASHCGDTALEMLPDSPRSSLFTRPCGVLATKSFPVFLPTESSQAHLPVLHGVSSLRTLMTLVSCVRP